VSDAWATELGATTVVCGGRSRLLVEQLLRRRRDRRLLARAPVRRAALVARRALERRGAPADGGELVAQRLHGGALALERLGEQLPLALQRLVAQRQVGRLLGLYRQRGDPPAQRRQLQQVPAPHRLRAQPQVARLAPRRHHLALEQPELRRRRRRHCVELRVAPLVRARST